MPNSYQRRKARMIAATILRAAAQSDTPMGNLPRMLVTLDERAWVTLSLAAGQSIADTHCRAMVVAILGGLA